MSLKAGEGMSKLAASPGPGGLQVHSLKRPHFFLLGHMCVLGLEAETGQGGAPREDSRSSCGSQLHPLPTPETAGASGQRGGGVQPGDPAG